MAGLDIRADPVQVIATFHVTVGVVPTSMDRIDILTLAATCHFAHDL
jgi:hypothetical protein